MDRLQYDISEQMLTREERSSFSSCLRHYGVDEAVWDIYESFLGSSSSVTRPSIMRAFQNGRLAGAAFFFICRAGGRTLFRNPLLAAAVNLTRMPSYIWFRQGICADLGANPGFFADGSDGPSVLSGMIIHLRRKALSLFITDLADNETCHPGAKRFPYVREGAVNVKGKHDISEFVGEHGKLKRKLRTFSKKGGTVEVLKGALDRETRKDLLRCVRSTMESSYFYAPYQDHFPVMIDRSCSIPSERLLSVIARLDGAFAGYHTFLRTGKGMRMLHGAFDRSRDSLYHAYENIITRSAEHAIREGLEAVYFGPILNETKRRMMNMADKTAIFFTSSNPLVRSFLPALYSRSSMQSAKLLEFS